MQKDLEQYCESTFQLLCSVVSYGISMVIETSVSIYLFRMIHTRFASRRRYKTEKRCFQLLLYPLWVAINAFGIATIFRSFNGDYC
jgi:hypothetical protein